MSARIAACLIVQDEQRRLPDALRSVAFCDETIVVDGGSRDGTVALARAAGARVIENPWPGYGAQRNVAIDATDAEWILEIDADERVMPELATSIQALVADPPEGIESGVLSLRNRFLGATLGPSAKYPQYRLRLFRNAGYRHDESLTVHEGLSLAGRSTVLEGDIEHELADSWREAFADLWRYARLQASHVASPRSPRPYVIGIFVRPASKLLYRLVLEGGWRDGWRGLAKIWLDCASDAAVWMLLMARAVRGDHSGALAADGHFGSSWWAPQGAVKVTAIAAGPTETKKAAAWLADVASAGAEVALVTDQAGRELGGVRLRRVESVRPLHVLRALEAERQLLPLDAVVACGLRGRLVHRLLPRHLRGAVDVALELSGAQAEARVRAVVRDAV